MNYKKAATELKRTRDAISYLFNGLHGNPNKMYPRQFSIRLSIANNYLSK